MAESEFVGVTPEFVYARNLSFVKWCCFYSVCWKGIHYASDKFVIPMFEKFLLNKLIGKSRNTGNVIIPKLSKISVNESALLSNYLFSLLHGTIAFYLSLRQKNLRQCGQEDVESALVTENNAIKGDLSFVNNSITYMVVDALLYELIYNKDKNSRSMALTHHVGWVLGACVAPLCNHGWPILYWCMSITEIATIPLNLSKILKRVVNYIKYFEKEFQSINIKSKNGYNYNSSQYNQLLIKFEKYEAYITLIFYCLFIYVRFIAMPPISFKILLNNYQNKNNFDKHKIGRTIASASTVIITLLGIVWSITIMTRLKKSWIKYKARILS